MMYASCFEVTMTVPGAASLKDRRSVVKSLKERCKSRFNVSVVECGEDGKWQKARLGFALAAISHTAAEQQTQAVIDYLYEDDRIDIVDIERL
jgi:uncharacterized protein YlxP (DUF503 family)